MWGKAVVNGSERPWKPWPLEEREVVRLWLYRGEPLFNCGCRITAIVDETKLGR